MPTASDRSKRKRFVVDVVAPYSESPGGGDDPFAEALGATHVDIAMGNVRYELAQNPGIEGDLAPRADELVKPTSPVRDKGGDLIAMDDVSRSRRPHNDSGGHRLGQVLEKGTQGCHPHAGTDEDNLIGRPGVMGEGAVGTFDGHAECRV